MDSNERLQIENGDKPTWVASGLGLMPECPWRSRASSSLPSHTANNLVLLEERFRGERFGKGDVQGAMKSFSDTNCVLVGARRF